MIMQDLSRHPDRWEAVLAARYSRIFVAIVFWRHPVGVGDALHDGYRHGP